MNTLTEISPPMWRRLHPTASHQFWSRSITQQKQKQNLCPIHTADADATRRDKTGFVASASAVCIGLYRLQQASFANCHTVGIAESTDVSHRDVKPAARSLKIYLYGLYVCFYTALFEHERHCMVTWAIWIELRGAYFQWHASTGQTILLMRTCQSWQ